MLRNLTFVFMKHLCMIYLLHLHLPFLSVGDLSPVAMYWNGSLVFLLLEVVFFFFLCVVVCKTCVFFRAIYLLSHQYFPVFSYFLIPYTWLVAGTHHLLGITKLHRSVIVFLRLNVVLAIHFLTDISNLKLYNQTHHSLINIFPWNSYT